MVNKLEPYAGKSLWEETDEEWDYKNMPLDMADWRVVGSRIARNKSTGKVTFNFPEEKKENTANFHLLSIEEIDISKMATHCAGMLASTESPQFSFKDLVLKKSYDHIFIYVIVFESGRLEIGYTREELGVGIYVIVVADRGKDCGRLEAKITPERYNNLIDKYSLVGEICPKEILKRATEEEVAKLKIKKEKEEEALKYCMIKNYLDMEIVSCEYQWDFNKLTFFFISKDRVDFRELVKELYKKYKTRIWMCCVEKSKNWCLKELLTDVENGVINDIKVKTVKNIGNE